MANIRSRHTKPELVVRSLLHSLGYRFRLHHAKLVGKPDIVLPRHKKIILVHGCFWHMHDCKRGNVTPKTNEDYWTRKRVGNVKRDQEHAKEYSDSGYQIQVVWECQTLDLEVLRNSLIRFLS